MQTTPRRVLAAFALTFGIMTPAAALLPTAANAAVTSNNGGDNGLGNCGHNSSGGAAHTGDQGNGGGNGGHMSGGSQHGCDDNSGGGVTFL